MTDEVKPNEELTTITLKVQRGGIWHPGLQCNVFAVAVANPTTVLLLLPRNNAPDLSAAIDVAESLLPDVESVAVFDGPAHVLTYKFVDGGWRSFVPNFRPQPADRGDDGDRPRSTWLPPPWWETARVLIWRPDAHAMMTDEEYAQWQATREKNAALPAGAQATLW